MSKTIQLSFLAQKLIFILKIIKLEAIFSFIFKFFLLTIYQFHTIVPMIDKKQAIKAKIQQKLREQEERKTQQEFEQDFDDDYSDYSDLQQPEQVDSHEEASNNYFKSMNELKDYLEKFQRNGDSEYTHKLLFDFFKAQAIFQNLQEDTTNQQIYEQFMKPQPIISENKPQFEQIDPIAESAQKEIDKKMTLKDKLQSGKFLSYGHIPQNDEIEQYRSISSEDQILQQDCLQELINKTRRGKQNERRKSNKKKQKVDDLDRSRSRSRSQSSHLSHRKNSHRRPLQFSEGEDSSNEAHYDSQESDIQHSESSQEQYSEDSIEQHDFEGVSEDFKHLDMYEQMQDFGTQDDLDYLLNSAINSGKQKKINGVQEYHFMKKNQKEKYFKKMTKQYQNDLKRVKQQKKEKIKQAKSQKRSQQKFVTFCDAIYYKNFNVEGKPTEIKIADEKQQVLVKAIWQYEEQ